MRVASFNILNGRSMADGEVDVGRLRDATKLLDADVLGLQEVDLDQPRSGGLDLTALAAEALGAADHRFAAAVVGTPGEAWRAAGDPCRGTAGPDIDPCRACSSLGSSRQSSLTRT